MGHKKIKQRVNVGPRVWHAWRRRTHCRRAMYLGAHCLYYTHCGNLQYNKGKRWNAEIKIFFLLIYLYIYLRKCNSSDIKLKCKYVQEWCKKFLIRNIRLKIIIKTRSKRIDSFFFRKTRWIRHLGCVLFLYDYIYIFFLWYIIYLYILI